MNKIPVGVLGASGYAGRELCRLVAGHPALDLAFATANEQRGTTARFGGREIRFVATDDAPLSRAALVFSALPHGASAPRVREAARVGARAVDLSADLRPGAGDTDAPYGLTELARAQLPEAGIVANPGCYPTATLLALAPLARQGLIRPGALISVIAASGVTGAGFTPRHDLLFAEVTEDYRPYAPGNQHRHLPEIRATLAAMGADNDLLFAPHLLPVARGILATITVPLTAPLADPLAPWRAAYDGEPFIELVQGVPSLRAVAHRNVVQIAVAPAANLREPAVVVYAAIDNLVKGAAGQAVQNANVMLGLDEPLGLPA